MIRSDYFTFVTLFTVQRIAIFSNSVRRILETRFHTTTYLQSVPHLSITTAQHYFTTKMSNPDTSLKLFSLQASRSIRIAFLLEELGVEYDNQSYERQPSMLSPPEYAQDSKSSFGKAPVLHDDGKVIVESGAITEYAQHLTLKDPQRYQRYIQIHSRKLRHKS